MEGVVVNTSIVLRKRVANRHPWGSQKNYCTYCIGEKRCPGNGSSFMAHFKTTIVGEKTLLISIKSSFFYTPCIAETISAYCLEMNYSIVQKSPNKSCLINKHSKRNFFFFLWPFFKEKGTFREKNSLMLEAWWNNNSSKATDSSRRERKKVRM